MDGLDYADGESSVGELMDSGCVGKNKKYDFVYSLDRIQIKHYMDVYTAIVFDHNEIFGAL